MREHRTAKMRKGIGTKFLCIISGCPAGAGKWHIFSFFYGFAKKKGRTHPL